MARAGSAGPVEPPGARRSDARAAGDGSPSWIDAEPSLWQVGLRTLARLGRRARPTWPWSLGIAVLIGGAVATMQLRAPPHYEVTTVLRISEGEIDPSGSNLSGQVLRAHVRDIAFTTEHLLSIVGSHPDAFPAAAQDPMLGLQALRDAMDFTLSENGFVEDRGPGDPPRSAWITLSFRAPTPERAWTITRDLSSLLVGSTLETQRAEMEREEAAAQASLRRVQDDLAALVRTAPSPTDPRVHAARERWRSAQEAATAAGFALRAANERQGLRFEVVDPGRKPEPTTSIWQVVPRTIVAFLAALIAGTLLAGAFDPRVVDGDDMGIIGITVLGQVPALPDSSGREQGGPAEGRV